MLTSSHLISQPISTQQGLPSSPIIHLPIDTDNMVRRTLINFLNQMDAMLPRSGDLARARKPDLSV